MNDEAHVYTVKSNGKQQRNTTEGTPLRGDAPAFSRDGKKIVFVGFDPSIGEFGEYVGIHTMKANGSDQRQLTGTGFGSDWQAR
jgi:Tol biopolymer transport system component